MEKNGRTKNIVLAVLLVAVVTLSIAYAVLSTTLTINSQATVLGANWDIHFQRVNAAESGDICTLAKGSTSSKAEITTQPTLAATSLTGLAVKLSVPGDTVTCTWEVTNAGDIDAALATFTKGTPGATGDNASVANDITYTLKYDSASGEDVAQGNKLPAKTGNTKTLVMTVKYNDNVESIPANDVSITGINATLIYEQD